MNSAARIFAIFSLFLLNASAQSASNNPFLQSKQNIEARAEGSGSRAVLIILDASGSMSDPANGYKTKMLMAKNVLEGVLSKVSDDVKLGLRVYGSSDPSYNPTQDCQDSVLMVPLGLGNKRKIVSAFQSLKPSGATPISLAMREAQRDLANISSDQKSVVLISDGMDTCGFDPCSLARSMDSAGIDIQFNVVGFGLGSDPRALKQMECIAASTDGKFYEANTEGELTESILDGINSYNASVTGTIQEER